MEGCSDEAGSDAIVGVDGGQQPGTEPDADTSRPEASTSDAPTAAVDCKDPVAELRLAVRGQTTPVLDAASAALSRDLAPAELDYMKRYNFAKATESDIAYDMTLVKAVASVGAVVDAACPGGIVTRRRTKTWSPVRCAHADDSRCLVASGIANVLAGAAVFAVGYAFCAATVNPLACVAATAIGIKLVRSTPTCTKPPPPDDDAACGGCAPGYGCFVACGGCLPEGSSCCADGKGYCPNGQTCSMCGSGNACLGPGGRVCPYPYGGFTQAACPGACPATAEDPGWSSCSPCAP